MAAARVAGRRATNFDRERRTGGKRDVLSIKHTRAVTRSDGTAADHIDRAVDRAAATQRAATVDRDRATRSRRAIHSQRATVDRCRAGVSVRATQCQRTGTGLGQSSRTRRH